MSTTITTMRTGSMITSITTMRASVTSTMGKSAMRSTATTITMGMETIVPVTRDDLEDVLKRLSETEEFGQVLRAKGMLPTENPGEWLYFDLVPEQYEIREGSPDYTGKVCVIGSSLNEEALNSVFGRG